MNTPQSLTELLALSQLSLRAYSVGRRIAAINTADWQAFEQGSLAVTTPLMGHEWLAISLVGDNNQSQGIWWLRLPLDEVNKLSPGQMTLLLEELAATINHNMKHGEAEQRAPMDHCQFAFTPSDEKRAAVVALERVTQQSPLSDDAIAVTNWIKAGASDPSWASFTMQALTDALNNPSLSSNHIAHFLENGPAPVVDQAFKILMHAQLSTGAAAQFASCSHPIAPLLSNQLSALPWHDKTALQTQTVATFQYCPTLFQTDLQLLEWLEALAQSVDTNTFSILTQDLLRIDKTRDMMWAAIRNTSRSDALSNAIGHLFNQR